MRTAVSLSRCPAAMDDEAEIIGNRYDGVPQIRFVILHSDILHFVSA